MGDETHTKKDAKVKLSPYYLSTSDAPRNIITHVQLKGENYDDWAKHVQNALRTKRKLGFVDGTIKKPTDPKEVDQWIVVNSMIIAWIMNTIEPTLRVSVSMVGDAIFFWENLKLTFSAGNSARIHELKYEIANCKQNGDVVMIYSGRLKKCWDELAVYKPIRTCSCGEITSSLKQDQEEDRVHKFLHGLDSKFGTVRSTLTSIKTLPNLAIVYQRIIREERQQSMTQERDEKTEVVGFVVQAGRNEKYAAKQNSGGYREGIDVECTHCGKSGHDLSSVYQLIGYPEWWGEQGGRGNGMGRGSVRGRGRGGGFVRRGGGRGGYQPQANTP